MCPHETAPRYGFRTVTRDDFPLLRSWLGLPHIGGWWGDPDAEIALMEEDLAAGPTDMRLVCLGDTPFAYVQDYPAHHWSMPQYAGEAAGARAIDTFLGDPAFHGRGHAARYMRQRALELVASGAPSVLTDPDPANSRAVAAYTRAGFRPLRECPCEDGDPVLVMRFSPPPGARHAP